MLGGSGEVWGGCEGCGEGEGVGRELRWCGGVRD